MMIKPTHFFFNTETAVDNEFMSKGDEDNEVINKRAIDEFDQLKAKIEEGGVTVVEYEQQAEDLPDSLFPNNWISFHKYPGLIEDRLVCVYPMKAPTRQREVNHKIIDEQMEEKGHKIDLTNYWIKSKCLEGTGSLIFDPQNQKIYAALSQRCEKDVLEHFLELFNAKSSKPFKIVTFTSTTATGTPIYHTNVMMSVLKDHCVVCLESINDLEERKMVVEELTSTHLNEFPKKIIEISLDEVNNMCGNIICVSNNIGEPCIIMPSKDF